MPKVGGRSFEYSPEGLRKARDYSSKTGHGIDMNKRYRVGGAVTKDKDGYATGGVVRTPTRGVGAATRGIDHYTVKS